jgi:hypothetical protein
MDKLKKYNDKFIENLEYNCNVYKLIGNGTTESPMWFQYRSKSFDEENGKLLFANSQKSSIQFEIELDTEDYWMQFEAFNNLYNYFRDLKYAYIKENHPTIYQELN